MSNILTPIVARYSLFFTLAMCSSSSISRSKQPTHLVQTLLIEAQQRYQDKSTEKTEKLRALIRHLSTTSTSSSSLSQSAASSSQLTTSSGAGSTEISSPSSSSYIQPAAKAAAFSGSASSSSTSRIEPPLSCLEERDMPSLPPVLNQEGSFLAAADNNNNSNDNNQASEHRKKDNKGKGATTSVVSALDRTEQEGNLHSNHNYSHNERSRSSSLSCSRPLIGDDDDAMATAASAVGPANAAATVSSDHPNQQQTSTLPSPSHSLLSVPVSVSLSFSSPSSSVAAAQHGQQARRQLQSGSNNNHNSSKVNKSSIAALLSVTLTMILLSLLQSKKRHLRRRSRSPRGTTSKRHSRRGSRQLLLTQQQHQEVYKSTGTDHLTFRSHSLSSSSHTTTKNNYNNNSTSSTSINFLLTDHNNNNSNINMDFVTPEGKRSSLLLTQSRPASFFGGGHGGEPISSTYHNSHHSLPLSTHGNYILSDPRNNNSLPHLLPSLPSSNPSYPPSTLHFDSTTRLLHQGNMYSGRDISYSLSDTNLPNKRSKRDLVADWLDQQTFVTPSDMVEAPEHLPLVQDGPNSNIADDNEPLHQIHHHHNAHHIQRQQQQQSKSFPAELDANQLYHQQSINNTGAQREPRQQQQGQQEQGQEPYPRVIQRINELYPGSRSSLYLASSASRHSMVALDQQQPQPTSWLSQQQQQQQQQSSSPSFWRDSPSQLQSQQQQFSPHQYRPQYQHYPQQQHLPHPQHPHPAHYGHYQQNLPQTVASPAYYPPYEPLGYEDLDQQDANHRRSLSLNNSGGRRGGARSRPQSQVYRKATPARFENLSLAEQARQEHQMRRQHYQQHYHQHRQQLQQQQQFQHQHQHQQYYRAPGSRPQSMYSNGYGAAASPREMNQFVPPRHHQAHPRPHLPSVVMQQHRHPSDLRHSTVSSPKTSNVSRSAHDLAWERHCYYQQQQMQEDALAERKRIEQQQHAQQQKRTQRPLSSVEGGLQVPLLQDSSPAVVRTSSMSRVSSSSTTAVLGGNAASTNGRITAVGKVALGSLGLSRSVSTSAIMDTKARAAKNRSSHPSLRKNDKESPATETETKSSAKDCKFLRLFRSDSKLSTKKTVSANTESPSTSTQAQTAPSEEQSTVPVIVTIQPLDSTTSTPSPATATTGLNRRRTLKDLAPSIRSLARRCSSRFSSNTSSSRPNSFAGSSSDPVMQFAEEKASGSGSNSLSMTTSYLPLKLSLTSLPRSLAPGPDGIVDLQQATSPLASSPLSVKSFPPASSSTTSVTLSDMPPSPPPQQQQQEQRVPIHRKVTLFRSKTLTLAKSSLKATSPPTSHADHTIDTTPSDSMTAADDHNDDNNNNNKNSSTRANSLPSRRRRQRDSLRLANGHGLDFDTFHPPTTTTAFNGTTSTSAGDQASAVEKSTNDLESALPGPGLGRSTGPPVLPAIVTTGGRPADRDQQQKARRQIISLLAMGRKDRISAKTGHAMKSGSSTASSPTTPSTASSSATLLSQLSPLALEAQEDLFVKPAAAEEKGGEEDPCEKIAFMLVPKSRYEFQPLVVA